MGSRSLLFLPLYAPHPTPVLKDAHKHGRIDALYAGSDQSPLCRHQAVHLRTDRKALPGKEKPRIPAEGKCIKAPDLRL